MTADRSELVESLLGRMSWTDKLNQLQIVWRRDPAEAAQLARNGIGALFWPPNAEAANELQRVAVEESPLGIPLLIGLDVVHGQFTIFPTPLAQAASFDPAVTELDGRVSATEARSAGVNWTFSPMVDVSRDPRWGRVVEGFGEDPYLTGRFGAAKVRGYQGESLAAPDSILACLKHYTAYGLAEGGRDYNTADLSEHRLRGVYLEPFRVALAAGAGSVMASFNTLNGVPMHGNRRLLTDVLKTEWGHQGIVVGDAEGVAQLVTHGVASDVADAVRLSLGAGLDVEMGGNVVTSEGEPILTSDDIDEARIDDAVRRVLRLKLELGLFDSPYVDAEKAATAATSSTRAAARTAAERSTVLLKNDGSLLPIAAAARRVLLTGPYARSTDHLGAWVQHFATPAGSLEDALRAFLPDTAALSVADGAGFLHPDPELLAEAVTAARDQDLVIVAVGEPSALSGEAASRSDIRLPGDQERLIAAIADSGVPSVVVLVTGRPLDVSAWIDRAPSVLLAWHLGTEAAPAIARTLVGEVNPGGRLPMTFPRTVGQVPIHYDHESTGRPARTAGSVEGRPDVGLVGPGDTGDHYTSKYLDLPLGPQFPFGHGLSYTEFELADAATGTATIAAGELEAGGGLPVTVVVRNAGDRRGDDVVQLYVRDLVASIAPAVRRLRGFERVTLEPGETRTVAFHVTREDLGFWTNDVEGRFVLEPGDFVLEVTDGTTWHELPLRVE